MRKQMIAKIIDDQIVISISQKRHNIYDIAFIEIIKEEIKFRKYFFIILCLMIIAMCYKIEADQFFKFLAISIMLFCLLFVFKVNPSKYHLLLSFKQFKVIKIPIKKRQLKEAENLIRLYKLQYQILDKNKYKSENLLSDKK